MLNILKKLDILIGHIITAIEITLFLDGAMKEGDHSTFLMEMMGFGTTNHLSSERFDEIRSDLLDTYDRVFEIMPTKNIIRIGRWDVSKITRRGTTERTVGYAVMRFGRTMYLYHDGED